MNVELFVLCDAATDYNGKLNILGTFDAVWASQMPAVQASCSIALRLRFSKIEEGEHTVKISIADADGQAVIKPVEGSLNVRFQNVSLTSLATNMILNLQGVKLPEYGEYSIDLAVDGRHEASLPVNVNKPPGRSDN